MKCDDLEIKYVGYGMGFYPTEDVDAAIAELKAENRRLKRALWLARIAGPFTALATATCRTASRLSTASATPA